MNYKKICFDDSLETKHLLNARALQHFNSNPTIINTINPFVAAQIPITEKDTILIPRNNYIKSKLSNRCHSNEALTEIQDTHQPKRPGLL